MFLAVILEDKTLKCIPIKWCFKVLVADTFNYGLNRYELHRIFYSSDAAKEANFLLPINSKFDIVQDSCYLGYTKRCFDTKNECDSWLERQRGILPAVYNPQRAAASAELHLAGERQVQDATDRARDIKLEVKKEMTSIANPLRKVVKALNDLLPDVHDLTESETEDFQNALEISDDEIDDFERGTQRQLEPIQEPEIQPLTTPSPEPNMQTQQPLDSENSDEEEPNDAVTGNLQFRTTEVSC